MAPGAFRPIPRIMALNRFYRPDHSATSQLLGELAEHLSRGGHDVTVIASRLLYEGGEVLPKNEVIEGVTVHRVATTRFGRDKLWGRAIDYLAFYASSFVCILRHGRRGDVLIIKTDPPLITIPATLAARLKGMKTINWCQDLFPEVAANLGIKWAGGPFGTVLRTFRNRSMRLASLNAVLHDKMAERLSDDGLPLAKIRVVPNWADRAISPRRPEENGLRESWGVRDRFVIGYSGNLGRAHLPDQVAQLVQLTKHIEGLTWLFIGGGAGIEVVRRAAGDSPNVLFKPYQARDKLSESLSVPDLHLVSLDPSCEGIIVPSKLYGIRAADRPILFLGDSDGAVARELGRYRAGWVLNPQVPDGWEASVRAAMQQIQKSPQRLMSPEWSSIWDTGAALALWEKAIIEAAGAQP
jgi:colanic acid biosynthesis glycosyl transferase WcaI